MPGVTSRIKKVGVVGSAVAVRWSIPEAFVCIKSCSSQVAVLSKPHAKFNNVLGYYCCKSALVALNVVTRAKRVYRVGLQTLVAPRSWFSVAEVVNYSLVSAFKNEGGALAYQWLHFVGCRTQLFCGCCPRLNLGSGQCFAWSKVPALILSIAAILLVSRQ
ncbi:hypothetical protein [Photobacterium jeanii]|uniref:hypothetical protein n=1 Tax=Photobacterium jeanii TaxID=858640 RepID=UPI000AE94793|nr:hypothetical protein [Photobacterium jeanii]